MRTQHIAVFEWICGGGESPETLFAADGLLHEGWGMLDCLTQMLQVAGYRVTAPVASWLFESKQTASTAYLPIDVGTDRGKVLELWSQLAGEVDGVLVIAPEFDSILEYCLERLSRTKVPLVNCLGEFLPNACDKLRTFQRFSAAGLLTPRTIDLYDFSDREFCQASSWIIKPCDGAGCQDIILTRDIGDIESLKESEVGSVRRLVQPWIEGKAYSCSAIVDGSGRPHWMPLCTQQLSIVGAADRATLKYVGGSLASTSPPEGALLDLLNQAVVSLGAGARGWVSFDLVHAMHDQQWYLIEVNPRCTTSVLGLSKAYEGNLADDLVASQFCEQEILVGKWSANRWRV